MKRARWMLGLLGAVTWAAGCGSSPTAPPVTATLTISAVSPSTWSTTGGATVTIVGSGFGTDTTIAVDGAAITGATVTATSISLTAPIHAAGVTSVVVTSGGRSASGAVTFVAPSGLNAAPVISNLKVTGPASKPPSPFVDLASSVTLSATVSDAETSPSTLTYAWTVAAGTISGTGPSVTWTLPSVLGTPTSVTATLTVTETYTENGVQHRNVVLGSLAADAHDSAKEILDTGFKFLDRFSQSEKYLPAEVVVDFDTSCRGYAEELSDTVDNRQNYLYLSYTITKLPPAVFNYGQTCPNPKANPVGDACSVFAAHWVAHVLRDVPDDGVTAGETITTDGFDYIGNVFRGGQWKLCSSNFSDAGPTTVLSLSGETRVIATPAGLVPGRIKRR